MDSEKVGPEVVKWEKGEVSAELYEDLLSRYERMLVFAGQLQEKNRQQLLLQEKNDSLEKETERLRRLVAIEESYVRLLERAFAKLGILREEKEP